MDIRLIPTEEIEAIIPLLKTLDPSLSEAVLQQRLAAIVRQGYVIILPAHQGKGAGKKLMAWIYQSGRENGCVASELNCYVGNSAGHRLWLNEGY